MCSSRRAQGVGLDETKPLLRQLAYAWPMRMSEAFADAGIQPKTTDSAFRVTCDGCQTEQRLDEMLLSDVAGVARYACKRCNRSLAGVKPRERDTELPADGGYRLNANMIGNVVDLLVDDWCGDGTLLLIPSTPKFFE